LHANLIWRKNWPNNKKTGTGGLKRRKRLENKENGLDIPLFNTFIDEQAQSSVLSVLESSYLSEGRLVQEFEKKLHEELGFSNPLGVNSGTAALHLAVILAGIKPGDEVICPAQTFIASAMVIIQEKATPVFADIKFETGNIDPLSVESKITPKTKAILCVHWGGMPCDLDQLQQIAQKYNLKVIEDAAHSPGATYKNEPIGSISDFTCFSFQAIKHLTTGDGGAICCKNKLDSDEAFKLRWFGIDRINNLPSSLGERQYNIKRCGYKYHLNDYAAALGLANLKQFKKRLARHRDIACFYRKSLKDLSGISLFAEDDNRKGSYWLFGFHVEKRDDFIKAMKSKGVVTSVVHQRIDRNEVFGGLRTDLPNQERFDHSQVNIPIYSSLTDEQMETIVATIRAGW
jgi:perosamine synthetase